MQTRALVGEENFSANKEYKEIIFSASAQLASDTVDSKEIYSFKDYFERAGLILEFKIWCFLHAFIVSSRVNQVFN